MDSTLRSNLSIGMPIDLLVYRRENLILAIQNRINEDDDHLPAMVRSAAPRVPGHPSAGLGRVKRA